MDKPNLILLFAGKRKSGKDFTVEKLQNTFGKSKCEIVRISEPIKSFWAELKGLDLNALLGDSEYKERYRSEMITWSEQARKENYGRFCNQACLNATVKPLWIVSDIRRKTDLCWFRENYGEIIHTIKVIASEETRKQRGWIFQQGVDNAESECDLDDVHHWDFIIKNNDEHEFDRDLIKLVEFTKSSL